MLYFSYSFRNTTETGHLAEAAAWYLHTVGGDLVAEVQQMLINGNSFARRIGATVARTSQMVRPFDGVRGVFAVDSLPRGSLVLRVPLRACISPASRACSALSSFQLWAGRLRLPLEPQLQLESTISSDDSPGGIVTFKLQPFEAALSFCVALHYFDRVLGGTVMRGNGVLRSTDVWFLSSIPMATIDTLGAESPFVSELGSHSSQDLHSCMEQVAQSMCDYLIEHWLSENQRRVVEASGEDLQWHLLSAIYAVRSRVLHLPVLGGCTGRAKSVPLVAPLLQMFNHSSRASANCAAVIAAGDGSVVLRTLRRIRPSEELTVDYRSSLVLENHQRAVEHPHVSLEDQQAADKALAWESRYQLSAWS